MATTSPSSQNLRKGRFSKTGSYYFLTTTVRGRRKIFLQPDLAQKVLNSIRWLHQSRIFSVDAAVIMPDHLHIAGQLEASSLQKMMHSLKSFTANQIAEHGIRSPIWQDGYHDHGLRDDEDYMTRVQYLLENPLRAGLVDRVEDYPYLILPQGWTPA